MFVIGCFTILAAVRWYHNIWATVFALLAVLLMGVILLQRGRGVGLSGAFGGAGGHTAFGAKTGDVLTWATIVIAVVLLTLTVGLNYVFVELPPIDTVPAPAQPMPQLPAEELTDTATPPVAPAAPAETTAPQDSATSPATEDAAPPPANPAGGEEPAGAGGDEPITP